MKGQDILVVLALLDREGPPPTADEVSTLLGVSSATVHRSFVRLQHAGLVDTNRAVLLAQADEFFAHALRFAFPPEFGGEARGVATAWAAPPLQAMLTDAGGHTLVWAHPLGTTRGIELAPLHPGIPELAMRNRSMYERLALADALRVGDSRVRGLAHEALRSHYGFPVP